MSVNINVTATTAEAIAELNRLANSSENALKRVVVASTNSTGALLKNNRALKSAIGGLALNASLFAGPDAQRFIYPLVLMQKELKGLYSATKLVSGGFGAVGLGVTGITAAVAIGVAWWQKYKAEMQAAAAEKNLFDQQKDYRGNYSNKIDKNAALERLPQAEADALKARLAAATPEGFRMEFERKKVMEYVGGGMGGQGGGRMMEVEREVGKRIETERLGEVEKSIQARLREVELTETELKQMVALKDKTEALHVSRLEGYEKERAAEQERYRLETRAIEEVAAKKKAVDQPALQLARQENEILHRKTIRDLEQKEWDEKIKAALEYQKIQDELALKEYDHLVKMRAEERQRHLEKIQNNPFLTDADKYRQTRAAGGDVSGAANPDSLPQQMTAAWVQMQNQIGTIQQQIASAWVGIMGAAIDSTTNSIMGLIDGTMTWNDALKNIGKTILTEVIRSIVRMGVQWLLTDGLITTAAVTGSATRASAKLTEAGAEAVVTGTKAAGSVADIPYVGWALAIAAFGSIIAMVASASGGFAQGGFTGAGGKYEVAGSVHRGEYVMDAATVQRLGVPRLDALRRGDPAALPMGSGGGSAVKQTINLHLDKATMAQAMRDDISAIALDAFRRNRVELGFQT